MCEKLSSCQSWERLDNARLPWQVPLIIKHILFVLQASASPNLPFNVYFSHPLSILPKQSDRPVQRSTTDGIITEGNNPGCDQLCNAAFISAFPVFCPGTWRCSHLPVFELLTSCAGSGLAPTPGGLALWGAFKAAQVWNPDLGGHLRSLWTVSQGFFLPGRAFNFLCVSFESKFWEHAEDFLAIPWFQRWAFQRNP